MSPFIHHEPTSPKRGPDAPQLADGQERPGQGFSWVQWLLGVVLAVFFVLAAGCPRLPDTMTWNAVGVSPVNKTESLKASHTAANGDESAFGRPTVPAE